MPLYEITLTASKVVKVHGENLDDASQRAVAENPTLDEVEATDGGEVDDGTFYDYLPDHIRSIVDEARSLPVLAQGQTANRVFDDGHWAVFVERVDSADGYDGPPVSVQIYDGNHWVDFDPDMHDIEDEEG